VVRSRVVPALIVHAASTATRRLAWSMSALR